MSPRLNTTQDFSAAVSDLLRMPSELAALRAEVAELRAELTAVRRALPPALVSVTVAAERLGVSVVTVRRMVKKGELPSVRVGGSIRVDLAALRPPSESDVAKLAWSARNDSR